MSVVIPTKPCSHCKIAKPLTEFYKNKCRKDGLHQQCKNCMSRYNSTIAAIINKKTYKKKYPEKLYISQVKGKYRIDITLDIYDSMLKEQQGRCKICGNFETECCWGTTKRLSVDHNHQTNKIRGLVCARCNKLLGLADDSVEVLTSAIDYLEKSKCQ